jgi:hypothetical protein
MTTIVISIIVPFSIEEKAFQQLIQRLEVVINATKFVYEVI